MKVFIVYCLFISFVFFIVVDVFLLSWMLLKLRFWYFRNNILGDVVVKLKLFELLMNNDDFEFLFLLFFRNWCDVLRWFFLDCIVCLSNWFVSYFFIGLFIFIDLRWFLRFFLFFFIVVSRENLFFIFSWLLYNVGLNVMYDFWELFIRMFRRIDVYYWML